MAQSLKVPSLVVGSNQSTSNPDGGITVDAGNVTLSAGNLAVTGNTTVTGVLSHGATPVPLVDPAQCTVVAAAGAANTSTITITLKDASGTAIARVVPFDVYVSDAATGIGISSTAASTGFSVASGGGVRLVTAVTKSIACVSSATGTCVLSLVDTAKTTYYVVLSVGQGVKVSSQLTSGSYG